MNTDNNKYCFEFPTRRLSKKEYSKIVHEINTNYSKYENDTLGVHYSYSYDNKCYKYYFENHGFNCYNVYSKKLVK
jgi:DNA-binding cell septation regulator SpoVG